MIEKIKRKTIAMQDNMIPSTIEELIQKYDLDNIEIKDFLDNLIDYLGNDGTKTEKERRYRSNSNSYPFVWLASI